MKITDLAKIAGVSPATISNALNNKKGISPEQRDKILEIAEKYGYKKKENRDEKKVIRFIVFKNNGLVFGDTPFFASLIEGIERESSDNGFEIAISHISETDIPKLKESLEPESIKGIILLATEILPENLSILNELKKPLVIIDSYFKPLNYDFVLIDNAGGIRKAFNHLRDNGHSKIGYLKSSVFIYNFYYRYKEYKDSMEENNLVINPSHTYSILSTLDGAYNDMKKLLKDRIHDLPTAFIADNDIIAIGAIQALEEYGIKVPDDISIIGFDDMPFSRVSSPKLTTIKVYKKYFGKVAVKRLIDKISNNDTLNIKMEIETKLIERNSVKNLK